MCTLPSATLLLVILPAPTESVDRSVCNYSQNIHFLVHFTVADVSDLEPQIIHGFLYWFGSSKLLWKPLKPSYNRVFQFCISTMKLYQVGYIFIYYFFITCFPTLCSVQQWGQQHWRLHAFFVTDRQFGFACINSFLLYMVHLFDERTLDLTAGEPKN